MVTERALRLTRSGRRGVPGLPCYQGPEDGGHNEGEGNTHDAARARASAPLGFVRFIGGGPGRWGTQSIQQ